jgi:hypothetical protein
VPRRDSNKPPKQLQHNNIQFLKTIDTVKDTVKPLLQPLQKHLNRYQNHYTGSRQNRPGSFCPDNRKQPRTSRHFLAVDFFKLSNHQKTAPINHPVTASASTNLFNAAAVPKFFA